jgi:hypothetical protein
MLEQLRLLETKQTHDIRPLVMSIAHNVARLDERLERLESR